MRGVSVDLQSHLEQFTTTMAPCFRVVRLDGTEHLFTGHDRDLVIDGDTYRSDLGFTMSEVGTKLGLAVDNAEITLPLASGGITKAAVLAGLFYRSLLDVFWVNWDDVTMGKMYEAKGWRLGKHRLGEYKVTFEVRSLSGFLTAPVLDLVSPSCPYTFGLDDGLRSRCPADLEASDNPYQYSGSVAVPDATEPRRIFSDTGRDEATDIFKYGKLTWTSGDNAGFSMEVESFDPDPSFGGEITLLLPMPYDISAGDQYDLWRGCDKLFATCKAFGFQDDFGGEPNVPTEDEALTYKIPQQ